MQGYLPRDLYNLNSCYGTEAELRDCLSALHDVGLKAIADIVINHRCAHKQVCFLLFLFICKKAALLHPATPSLEVDKSEEALALTA